MIFHAANDVSIESSVAMCVLTQHLWRRTSKDALYRADIGMVHPPRPIGLGG
jgi:hypothetical protein